MLFSDFVNDCYLPYAQQRKRSWRIDASLLKRHLMPEFGEHALETIAALEIVRFQTLKLNQGYKRASVNRMTVLLKFIINCAIRWKYLTREGGWAYDAKELPLLEKKERFLSMEEARRLICACKQSHSPVSAHLILLLLLTGARKSELLLAKWSYLDLVSNTLCVPLSKSNRSRYLYLSRDAIALIESLKNISGDTYMFSVAGAKRPTTDLQRTWNIVRSSANLEDLRLHDLRHSYASFLIAGGRSLFEVQRLLGHADAKTTMRYAHLASAQLVEAASTIESRVGRISFDSQPDAGWAQRFH
jgi:integrase